MESEIFVKSPSLKRSPEKDKALILVEECDALAYQTAPKVMEVRRPRKERAWATIRNNM